ncbi:hypothetical protein diail_4482 [Diaporthe ilicicola]|nr:hypothetical protein diail_4482 [Diaporthe ilicicola]
MRLMNQYFAKYPEVQERKETIESLKKVTEDLEELEVKKQELTDKLTESDDPQLEREVELLKKRVDALLDAASAAKVAMHTESDTEDVVGQVVESALRSDHLTASKIMNITVNTSMQVHGGTRAENVVDFCFQSVHREENLKSYITAALNMFADPKDVVRIALEAALEKYANSADLRENVMEVLAAMLGDEAATTDSDTKIRGQ